MGRHSAPRVRRPLTHDAVRALTVGAAAVLTAVLVLLAVGLGARDALLVGGGLVVVAAVSFGILRAAGLLTVGRRP